MKILNLKDIQEKMQKGEKVRHFFGKSNRSKMMDEKKHSTRVIVSNERLNRHRMIVMDSAYDMSDFMKHPVLLASHGRYSLSDIIGQWHDMQITKQGLEGTAEYFVENAALFPQAPVAWMLVEKGLAAYSIGFNAKKALFGKDIMDSKDIPRRIKNKQPRIVFTEIELEEVSQCVVPVNADAVTHSMVKDPEVLEVIELARDSGFYGDDDPLEKFDLQAEEEERLSAEEQEKAEEAKEEEAKLAKEQEAKGEEVAEQVALQKEKEGESTEEETKSENKVVVPETGDLEVARIQFLMQCNNAHDVYKEFMKTKKTA